MPNSPEAVKRRFSTNDHLGRTLSQRSSDFANDALLVLQRCKQRTHSFNFNEVIGLQQIVGSGHLNFHPLVGTGDEFADDLHRLLLEIIAGYLVLRGAWRPDRRLDLIEIQTAKLHGEVVGDLLQPVASQPTIEFEEPFLQGAIGSHEHTEHPRTFQPDQRYRFEEPPDAEGTNRNPRFMGYVRRQSGNPGKILHKLPPHFFHPRRDLSPNLRREAAAARDAIDIKSQRAVGWNGSRRRVGPIEVAGFFEFGHHVADGGRREPKPGNAGDLARRHRLGRADVKLDDGAQHLEHTTAQLHTTLPRGWAMI